MDARVWKDENLANLFVNRVRGNIPLAAEQIMVMQHVVRGLCPRFQSVLDLGCGDGILGQAMLELNPTAKAYLLDFSEPLLSLARQRMAGAGMPAEFLLVDYGVPGWSEALAGSGGLDLIVSGFSIHHQNDDQKRRIYADLFSLLRPGGLFLNLEHVLPGSPSLTALSDALFVDAMHAAELKRGGSKGRDELEAEYMNRSDKEANILAPLDLQCRWLRELGFAHVDCFFKIFELALFGGQKPRTDA